ncbi:MAG: DUF1743 domain-containing protein [Euryarchaeota archaeon]|jgi:tRNA(Ile2)-agmatinylcytidine synthase|nr:DUF1743 domain-containing protein [Euryarchaeota archaeon]
MVWLGLDDTDSLEGGCTTEMFCKLLKRLEVSYRDARLVRLWPFAAKRTRGNASVGAELLCSFDEASELIDGQWNWFLQRCEKTSEPVLVLSKEQPPEQNYWSAVRRNVLENELIIKGENRSWGEGSGLIGAVAAISWTGEHDHTWEHTVYRLPSNIGTKRMIPSQLHLLDEMFPGTFLNRDPRLNKGLIAPRSPCPVLLGIRAESSEEAKSAWQWLSTQEGIEEHEDTMLWRTNQACDDHIESSIVAVLLKNPIIREKGHCSVQTNKGEVVAFAEGGYVNKLLQKCVEGDEIEFIALKFEGFYHLERIRLLKPVLRNKKRPLCECGVRMKSKGVGQLVKCPECKTTTEVQWIGSKVGSIDWVEPAGDRRRHLAAPLSRMQKS